MEPYETTDPTLVGLLYREYDGTWNTVKTGSRLRQQVKDPEVIKLGQSIFLPLQEVIALEKEIHRMEDQVPWLNYIGRWAN